MSSLTAVSGRLLTIVSTSVRRVMSWKSVTERSFSRVRSATLTHPMSLSHAPPMWGASGGLKCHSMLFWAATYDALFLQGPLLAYCLSWSSDHLLLDRVVLEASISTTDLDRAADLTMLTLPYLRYLPYLPCLPCLPYLPYLPYLNYLIYLTYLTYLT